MHCSYYISLVLFAFGIAGNPGDNEGKQADDDGSSLPSTNLPPDFSGPTTATGTTTSAVSSSTSTSDASINVITKSVGSSVSFSVHVPSSGSSDLFMQISSPSSMSWVGLGQGSQMKNSNMFIIFADAAGTNVTLSPRLGARNAEPVSASSSALTLCSGSGISNGIMKANILCTNCQSWTGGSMSYTSTSAPFIWAYKFGSSISSDSKSAHLAQHDNYGTLKFNLVSATGGSSSSSFPNSGTTAASSSASDKSGDSSSGDNGIVKPGFHGTLGVISFVLLFPLGAIVLRVFTFKYVVYTHIFLQLFSYALALATLVTGILLAKSESLLTESHPIVGIIVIVALFIQPILGFAHHASFRKRAARGQGGKNAFTAPHIWWGRLWITVGIIDGALGLALSHHSTGIVAAYSVAAGIIWLLWVSSVVWSNGKLRRGRGDKFERERNNTRESSQRDTFRLVEIQTETDGASRAGIGGFGNERRKREGG